MKDLPKISETKRDLTFAVPNVLLKYEIENGVPTMQVRLGGPKQVEHIISIEFVEAAIDESDQLFIIKARNQVNVAGVTVTVLNDEIKGDKPLAPSSPTATEYMHNVGKSVLLYFSCRSDPVTSNTLERDVFKVVRSRIILP